MKARSLSVHLALAAVFALPAAAQQAAAPAPAAATLIQNEVAPADACRMALVRPITDDADIRATLDHAIDAVFG